MGKRTQIERMVRDTVWNNAEIAKKLKCSKRLVRLYGNPIRKSKQIKVLLFDIETSPMEKYAWSLFDNGYTPIHMVIKDWAVLCWSAKWLFDSKIMSEKVNVRDAQDRKDNSIMQGLWNLLDEANVVIAHYGSVFDVRKMNLRFLVNGIPPPSPYQVIDTVKATKRTFAISSYKMEYINKILGLQCKKETKFELWKRCVTGDTSALREMEIYNRHDVTALEELYIAVRPWIKSHPNIGLYINTTGSVCSHCGSNKLKWGGNYDTPAGQYRAFRCNGCGAIGRTGHSSLSKDDRASLTRSLTR